MVGAMQPSPPSTSIALRVSAFSAKKAYPTQPREDGIRGDVVDDHVVVGGSLVVGTGRPRQRRALPPGRRAPARRKCRRYPTPRQERSLPVAPPGSPPFPPTSAARSLASLQDCEALRFGAEQGVEVAVVEARDFGVFRGSDHAETIRGDVELDKLDSALLAQAACFFLSDGSRSI